ncbi:ArnT family glycosyltransferase [Nevskia ramosa]|uniref:ArnT family glycosyltransferase n=1 Tax=Nevskia ramosa TaxID=64002 RepID=UPI003D134889
MLETERLSAAHLGFLFAAVLLGFWSNLWAVPLFDLDEGAFSQATREMLATGQWLITTLNGEPRYDKPILIYWAQAASVSLFGANELGFRFPSALCASAWMFVVFRATFMLTASRNAALLAAGAVALSLMSSVIGHAAIADAMLNLWIALVMLGIYQHWLVPTRGKLLRIYLWMGLGFLTKGPIAVALPVIVSLVFYLSQRQPLRWLAAVFDPYGWLVFLAVVALWMAPLAMTGQTDFFFHFLFEHNLTRYGSTMQGHGGKLWYYVAALPLIVLPFTALLPGTFARLRKPDPLDVFLLLWFAFVFLFFSFSGTQLPHYLLYGCTPLFVLFGRAWNRLPAKFWTLLPALLFALLLASLPWVLPMVPIDSDRPYEAGIVSLAARSFGLDYMILSGAVLIIILVLLFRRRTAAWQALLGAAMALSMLVWFGFIPVLAAAQQLPVREAALRAKELGTSTVSYRTYLPTFSVYRGAITPNRLPEPGELVFVKLDRIPDLQRELGASVTLIPEFKKGGVALLLRQGEARR